MGTQIEVLLYGGGGSAAREAFVASERIAETWERMFSRFRADSELSELNREAGRPVQVSALLYEAVEQALEATRLTGGLFNPLTLPALIAHGYDRSFEQVREGHGPLPERVTIVPALEIELDPLKRAIRLPDGSALDLGGIAKGMFADRLATHFAGWRGGAVSAGGDMRLWGEGPDDGRWIVGIEHPDDTERDLMTLSLHSLQRCGMATSGINRRSWRNQGRTAHHLIDPRSGAPANSRLRAVTAIASSATIAEIASTALFIDPAGASMSPIAREIQAAVLVSRDGAARSIRFDRKATFDVLSTC
jgi:thiamine biosynthesis lipoprotein